MFNILILFAAIQVKVEPLIGANDGGGSYATLASEFFNLNTSSVDAFLDPPAAVQSLIMTTFGVGGKLFNMSPRDSPLTFKHVPTHTLIQGGILALLKRIQTCLTLEEVRVLAAILQESWVLIRTLLLSPHKNHHLTAYLWVTLQQRSNASARRRGTRTTPVTKRRQWLRRKRPKILDRLTLATFCQYVWGAL